MESLRREFELKLQVEKLQATMQVDQEKAEKKQLQTTMESLHREFELKLQVKHSEIEKLRVMIQVGRTSTEAALAQSDDVLAEAFDKAEVVDFWLPMHGKTWDAK